MKSETTVVRFLDYGGRKVLDKAHLASPLDTQYMMLPCQALSVRLGRMVGRLAGGTWGRGVGSRGLRGGWWAGSSLQWSGSDLLNW